MTYHEEYPCAVTHVDCFGAKGWTVMGLSSRLTFSEAVVHW